MSVLSQLIRMSISPWTLSRCKLFTGRSCRYAMRQPDAPPVEMKQSMPGRGVKRGRAGDAGVSQRRAERTVYILPNFASRPRAVQIKTGISDGIMTEVLEGLKEADRVVTAELTS